MKSLSVLTLLLIAIVVGPPARAASISLVYTGDRPVTQYGVIDAPAGTSLSFDIVMDFTDIPTLGGGFDVIFDPTRSRFDGLVNNMLGDPLFGRDPDIFEGLLESWAFGSFMLLAGPATVGSVAFTVLPAVDSGLGFIALGPTSGIGGPFICDLGACITTIDVDYNSVHFGVVPLPAALWLMLAGLLALTPLRHARTSR